MAITATGAMYKGFTFDGVSSKTYGVYISGDAVFNAPERDVEMIEIPGRNGAYVLDKGRFANITVTYPAGIFGTTESDFAEGISDLRNILASKKGYCRLEDEYNPDEYRMAVYRSGLDVTPAQLKAGEFEIVFDCMPQRFLTSGETKTAVASGGSVTNPTLFDASPLLEFKASADSTITVNGSDIGVEAKTYGHIVLSNGGTYTNSQTFTVDANKFKTGDNITVANIPYIGCDGFGVTNYGGMRLKNGTLSVTNMEYVGTTSPGSSSNWSHAGLQYAVTDAVTFTAGTSSTYSASGSATLTFYNGPGANQDIATTTTFSLAYNGSDTFTVSVSFSGTGITVVNDPSARISTVSVSSTKQILSGTTIYVDLDIGEAWAVDSSNTVISANDAVSMGGELPVLSPGSNTITYPGTVTDFKITPRWWKV